MEQYPQEEEQQQYQLQEFGEEGGEEEEEFEATLRPQQEQQEQQVQQGDEEEEYEDEEDAAALAASDEDASKVVGENPSDVNASLPAAPAPIPQPEPELPPVILITTVDIGGGKSDAIELRKGGDPTSAARVFCEKHNLPSHIIAPLTQHILDNLSKAKQVRV